MPDHRPTIAVDFDGVLHSYTSGWRGAHTIPDPPVDGAIEWLWCLAQNHDVVIVSSRARTWRGRRAIRRWIRLHAGALWSGDGWRRGTVLRRVRITATKVPAVVYLDDRALRFEGAFPSPDELRLAGIPWMKRAKEAPDAAC